MKKPFLIPNMQQALELLTPCTLPNGRGTALLTASDVGCAVLQAGTGGGRIPEFAEIHLQALCLEPSSPRESKMLFSVFISISTLQLVLPASRTLHPQ